MKEYIEHTLGQRNNSTKAFNYTSEQAKWDSRGNQHYTGDIDINNRSIKPKANGLVGGEKEHRLDNMKKLLNYKNKLGMMKQNLQFE